jgi:hypothetical protein
MKIHKQKLSATLVTCIMLSVGYGTVFASEVTGTLSTGLSSTVSVVEGVVITPPAVSPVAGTYTSAQSVALTAVGSLSIRYTLDGSTPSCTVGTLYTAPISIGTTQTLKAISCYAQDHSSTVASYLYTINIPTSGGGGGGGGGSTVINYPAVIFNQNAVVPIVNSEKKIEQKISVDQKKKSVKPSYKFQRNLKQGARGTDVTELQKFLIAEGHMTGEATGYFGSLTKASLIRWQVKNKIPSTGYFGPMTRDYLEKMNSTQ